MDFTFTLRRRRQMRNERQGGILVWFAILLVVLLGLTGLVIDGGMLMTTHRQAQNAADAAALAAAMDKMRGQTNATATTTATTFVQTHNGLSSATLAVNIPPQAGPYSGNSNYVEVIVTTPYQTSFIQILGGESTRSVSARAVAGFEARGAGEGVMVLDPGAKPGLSVTGQGQLRVLGRVVVNSEAGGVDENGVSVDNGNNGVAASGGPNNAQENVGIYATTIDVVGGVDKPSLFKPYEVDGDLPLRAKALPEADPLITLPTPTTSNGVDSTQRGNVSVTNNNASGVITYTTFVDLGKNGKVPDQPPQGASYQLANGYVPSPGEVILHPGIYDSLSITGGKVYLIPGIYVLAPQQNTVDALKITGGVVVAQGIMFYNTSKSYSPGTGNPDAGDASDATPLPQDDYNGGFSINSGMIFTPIKSVGQGAIPYSTQYPGAKAVSSVFDGMLFYQRRRNKRPISITGNAADGVLSGTLYAKWSNFAISGQGTYNAQFIAGSINVSGNGNITILGAGDLVGKANKIFLVE